MENKKFIFGHIYQITKPLKLTSNQEVCFQKKLWTLNKPTAYTRKRGCGITQFGVQQNGRNAKLAKILVPLSACRLTATKTTSLRSENSFLAVVEK